MTGRAAEITTREIEQLMRSAADERGGTTDCQSHRAIGLRDLQLRHAREHLRATGQSRGAGSSGVRSRIAGPLPSIRSEEVEDAGRGSGPGRPLVRLGGQIVERDEAAARAFEDAQDAELIRIAAYTGLRRGELIALKWRDVDFPRHKVIVRRAVSAEVELNSTKSRRAREVPLPDQAAAALDRLSRRVDFTSPDDYVFVNRLGRRVDGSALRRRFERARSAAGLEPLRFHDLRHTYGSLLIAGGIDLASVKQAMGHSRISTTERYLHARPASALAARFTRALGGAQDAEQHAEGQQESVG